MRSTILLFAGVILIGTGIVVYNVLGTAFTEVSSVMPSSMDGLQALLQYGVGGGMIGVGAIMTISSLIEVGSSIKIKYLQSDPSQSAIAA